MARIIDEGDFLWQAQYLVRLNCHFSCQAQYFVKFGMIAGPRNVVFVHTKCSGRARRVTSVCEAGCGLTGSWSDHARIMLGTVSDRSRVVNDVSAVLVKFESHFGRSFFVAGAVFGEVGP